MKVVDGKFGKQAEDEELTLWEKISLAFSNVVEEDSVGNFVLITDTGDGLMGIVSDTDTGQSVYLLELAKLNLIMNDSAGGELH